MGAKYLTWAETVPLAKRPGVSLLARRHVLVMLASYANGAGEAWPSVKTLAAGTMDRMTARAALVSLAADGLISRVGQPSNGRVPTRWQLHPDRTQPASHSPVDDAVSERPTGESSAPTGEPLATNRRATRPYPALTRIDPAGKAANAIDATSSTAPTPGRRRRSGAGPPRTKGSDPTASKGSARTPERQRAETLVREWWERQTPRPAQPFIAIVKIVEKVIRDGWPSELVAQALDEMPVVSGAAFDFWRRKRTNGTGVQIDINNTLAMVDALAADREDRARRLAERKQQ